MNGLILNKEELESLIENISSDTFVAI